MSLAQVAIRPSGFLVIGTFLTKSPTKCSGLEVQRYSEETLTNQLQQGFAKIRCRTEDHLTPVQTIQNFLFYSCQRLTLAVIHRGKSHQVAKDRLVGVHDCNGTECRFASNNQYYPILNPGETLS